MRILTMWLAILFAIAISSCGGEDAPRNLNFEEELETDSGSEDDGDKATDVDVDTESDTGDDIDDDTTKPSDLAANGMWRCLICDPGD